MQLDLAKKWYKIFIDAIDSLKAYKNTDYVMVESNCRLEVIFKNGRTSFFDNISDFKNLIVEETLSKKTSEKEIFLGSGQNS